eukprot:CAMPEP_0198733190 /NCGR_PEP_ID=MMETSP1475-20131203/43559_1 /TAXON_ID= ORGANISM="Unidentified sp., Strain CCMP1999" /NCGR_SAMPLE_ID=MMETSP1475 /ASSEMBLY_ACC=CAM_ASM_001111 /LENGTH=570 /DNA_ID=CAMNT_0044496445 /DNA_START=81 /DNA_END=1790 /DNA_ORIENTATION=+
MSVRGRQTALLDSILSMPGEQWKVLVTDAKGEQIVGELKRSDELRKAGVTVTVSLGAERVERIPDSAAVYLVSSGSESARLIADDARKEIFGQMYVCFLSEPAPLDVLSEEILSPYPPRSLRISSVMTSRADFVSPDASLFHLGKNMRSAAWENPELVVHGLLCVLSTIGAVPIVRAQKGGLSEKIGQLLVDRLRADLMDGRLMPSSLVARPLLVLIDREKDLSTALRHPWTYRAMIHDVLGLSASTVEVTVREGTGERRVKYRLGAEEDHFWRKHATSSFPEVAAAVESELNAYLAEVAEVNRMGVDTAAAMASLPDLAKKKELIDMHMNIATALLEEIKIRSLDELFQAEEDGQLGSSDRSTILSIIKSEKGTKEDKLRLFLVSYFSGYPMTQGELEEFSKSLEEAGCSLDIIQRATSLRATSQAKQHVSPLNVRDKGRLGLMVSGMVQKGKTNLKKGMKEVAQNINKLVTLSGGGIMPISKTMNALMDHRGSSVENGFTYLDAKLRDGTENFSGREGRAYSDGIVFVVGGGNYIEYENVIEHCESRNVIYGSTSLLTGEEFLQDFAR